MFPQDHYCYWRKPAPPIAMPLIRALGKAAERVPAGGEPVGEAQLIDRHSTRASGGMVSRQEGGWVGEWRLGWEPGLGAVRELESGWESV